MRMNFERSSGSYERRYDIDVGKHPEYSGPYADSYYGTGTEPQTYTSEDDMREIREIREIISEMRAKEFGEAAIETYSKTGSLEEEFGQVDSDRKYLEDFKDGSYGGIEPNRQEPPEVDQDDTDDRYADFFEDLFG